MKKTNKTKEIIKYLENYGSITTYDAFKMFGATRLSAIIYNLRHNYGMNIKNKTIESKDRYGNTCNFDAYILVKED